MTDEAQSKEQLLPGDVGSDVSRRKFLEGAATLAAVFGVGSLLSACGGEEQPTPPTVTPTSLPPTPSRPDITPTLGPEASPTATVTIGGGEREFTVNYAGYGERVSPEEFPEVGRLQQLFTDLLEIEYRENRDTWDERFDGGVMFTSVDNQGVVSAFYAVPRVGQEESDIFFAVEREDGYEVEVDGEQKKYKLERMVEPEEIEAFTRAIADWNPEKGRFEQEVVDLNNHRHIIWWKPELMIWYEEQLEVAYLQDDGTFWVDGVFLLATPTPTPIPPTPTPTRVPPTETPKPSEGPEYNNAAVDALIPNYQLSPPRDDPTARQGITHDGLRVPVNTLRHYTYGNEGKKLTLTARIVEIKGGYVKDIGYPSAHWDIVIARAEDGAGNPTQTQPVRLNLNSPQTKLWRRQEMGTRDGCRGPECLLQLVNDSVINHRLLQPGDFLELVIREGRAREAVESGQGLLWVSELAING